MPQQTFIRRFFWKATSPDCEVTSAESDPFILFCQAAPFDLSNLKYVFENLPAHVIFWHIVNTISDRSRSLEAGHLCLFVYPLESYQGQNSKLMDTSNLQDKI
jgi:hypothetical protein